MQSGLVYTVLVISSVIFQLLSLEMIDGVVQMERWPILEIWQALVSCLWSTYDNDCENRTAPGGTNWMKYVHLKICLFRRKLLIDIKMWDTA